MLFSKTFLPFVILAAMLASLIPAPEAGAQGPKDVIKLVPEDAWAFVVLKSLGTVDDKAALLKETLGLQFPTPVTPMALAPLQVGDKIDMTMPVGIVLLDAKKYGGGTDFGRAAILLVPAADPQALLDALAPKEKGGEEPAGPGERKGAGEDKPADKKPPEGKKSPKERRPGANFELHQPAGKNPPQEGEAEALPEGLTRINVMGQPAFAAVKGKYLIVGPSQEGVAAVMTAKKNMAEGIADARMAALEKSDIYLSLSASTVVKATKDMFKPLLLMATAASDPEGKNIERIFKVFEELSACDLSVKFDKAGLTLIALLTPQKGSDLEKLMGDAKSSDKPLLAMLPNEKYLFTMGTTGGYSEYSGKFGDENWFSQMIKSSGVKGLNEDALKTIDAELMKMAKSAGPFAMCLSFIPEGAEGMFGVTIVAQPKAPQEYVDGIRKIYKTLLTVAETSEAKEKAGEKAGGEEGKKPPAKTGEAEENEGGSPAGKNSPKEWVERIKKCIIHTPDAETIDGKKIDTLAVKLEVLAELGQLKEDDVGYIQKVLGDEVAIRFGAVDDKNFVVTFGGGKKRFEAVCKHLKSAGDSMDKDAGIKEAATQLPSPRVSEFFFAGDNIVQAVKAVVKALGEEEEFPFDVPAVNAPVAMSGALMGSTQQINIVVPMKLIKAIKEGVDKQAGAGDFDEDEDEPAPKPADKAKDKAAPAKEEGKAAKPEKKKEKDEEDEDE